MNKLDIFLIIMLVYLIVLVIIVYIKLDAINVCSDCKNYDKCFKDKDLLERNNQENPSCENFEEVNNEYIQ